MKELIEKLAIEHDLADNEWQQMIEGKYDRTLLYARADEIRRQNYGTDVYIRGLIEISAIAEMTVYIVVSAEVTCMRNDTGYLRSRYWSVAKPDIG